MVSGSDVIAPVLLGQNRVGEEHLTEGGFKTEELKWQKTLHLDENKARPGFAS